MHADKRPAEPGSAAADPVARREWARRRQEQLLDEALMETFPASDPVSVARVT